MDDPLNISVDTADTDTSMPLAPAGDYECQVTKSSIDPNKARTGHNWNLELKTTAPVTTVEGKTLDHMTFFVNNIGLQPSESAKDPEGFKRNIAAATDAVLGTSKGSRPRFDRNVVEQALGKTVVARVVIEKNPNSGEDVNKVSRMKKVTHEAST